MCWDEAWEEGAWFTWFGRDLARKGDDDSPIQSSEGQAAIDEAVAVMRAQAQKAPGLGLLGLLRSWLPGFSRSAEPLDDVEVLTPPARR